MRLTLTLWVKRLRDPWRRAVFFNNAWHRTRNRLIRNERIVQEMNEKGFNVVQPESLYTAHLPSGAMPDDKAEDFLQDDPVKGSFDHLPEEAHPLYQTRPAFTYNERSFFPQGRGYQDQLRYAKSLLNTVEISSGLPSQVTDSISQRPALDEEDERVQDVIRDTCMFDAVQKKLPKRTQVPYIGWHPVESTMTTRMPYPVKRSYGWNERRRYGIPLKRRNQSLVRSLFRLADQHCPSYPSLVDRLHIEDTAHRQFFERRDDLVRLYFPLSFIVTDPNPLEPFANADAIESTKHIPLPDTYPIDPVASLFSEHIYRHENNFPIKATKDTFSAPFITMGVENNLLAESRWKDADYQSRALVMSFAIALGQARMLYGPEVKGHLEKPIAVQFVVTHGDLFHFSAFQLNTLDFDGGDGGVKNIFWHEEKVLELFSSCEYKEGIPTLEGYNEEVFDKLAGMYLVGAK